MLADERRNIIIEYMKKHQRAAVKELSQYLSVSEPTLRMDLRYLEEEGIVRRIHGGAVLAHHTAPWIDTSFNAREQRNKSQKTIIGQAATAYIQDGQCLIIDASTTSLELARLLRGMELNLTILTSGLYHALELKENPHLHVILIGGALRNGSAAVEGLLGAGMLEYIRADWLITSPAGFKVETGLMDFNLYEVELKRRMVSAANRMIALCDSSKIHVSSLASYANTEEIDIFITDEGVGAEDRDKMNQQGMNLVIAKDS